MASPVKPTLNGSIPISLTSVTKLCVSSVSFRHSTGVYKSDSIGSTGERNTVLTCQSTDVSSNQPASSNCRSSDQPAFRWISAGVSGQLNRRNQPAFKPYASDRPALRKSAGSTCHISLLPPRHRLHFLCFTRVLPSRRRPARFAPPPPFHATAPSLTHTYAAARLHAASPSRRRRASTSAHPAPLRSRTRARAANTPHVRCRHRVPPCRRQGQSRHPCTTRRPRSSTLRRSRSAFSLAGCSPFCSSHFLRCFRAALAFQHSRATF